MRQQTQAAPSALESEPTAPMVVIVDCRSIDALEPCASAQMVAADAGIFVPMTNPPPRSKSRDTRKPDDIAHEFLGVSFVALDEHAKKVARHVAQRKHIARNLTHEFDAASPSRGQRAADAVALFGGSWTFVGLFAAAMLIWVGLNAVLLVSAGGTFDPYPYILLNLFLSMLAAIQAPIILMSQNRQSAKDRVTAEHDYEVNLKAELEIMLLHEKIDALRETQWAELLEMQAQQLTILTGLISKSPSEPAASH